MIINYKVDMEIDVITANEVPTDEYLRRVIKSLLQKHSGKIDMLITSIDLEEK